MTNARAPSLLIRLSRSTRRSSRRAQEPADMGTAFGMESILDQQPLGETPAKTPSAGAAGWLPRWLRSASRL